MADRRKQGDSRSTSPAGDDLQLPSSAASQTNGASSAHRSSSLSSAYADSAFSVPAHQTRATAPPEGAKEYEYTSIKNLSESKNFWGILTEKAKNILELESAVKQDEHPSRNCPTSSVEAASSQSHNSETPADGYPKAGKPKLRRGLNKITSSLNYIGGKVGSTLEEGLSIVETRTANIIQESKKLNIKKKGSVSNAQTWMEDASSQHTIPQLRMDLETQLKAARDVSNAMAAKAKLLMRELKTVKADLAFAKERCAQLEEESRILREHNAEGGHPEDDDLIRLQLESLLAEKGRLAQENSVYARENRFLREIVEYHQLKMQDVVYLDEGVEDITQVYPTVSSQSRPTPRSPPPPHVPSLRESSSFPPPVPPAPPPSLKPANLSRHSSFEYGGPPIFPVPPSSITEDMHLQSNSHKEATY